MPVGFSTRSVAWLVIVLTVDSSGTPFAHYLVLRRTEYLPTPTPHQNRRE